MTEQSLRGLIDDCKEKQPFRNVPVDRTFRGGLGKYYDAANNGE
jgi:hypothetical protein